MWANLVTFCGILSATLAVAVADTQLAVGLLVVAVVADFLDGIVARSLGASAIGKRFDSVADFYCFGLCGSVVLADSVGWVVALLFGCGCGYRLCYRQIPSPIHLGARSFSGLPVPAGMLLGLIPLMLPAGLSTGLGLTLGVTNGGWLVSPFTSIASMAFVVLATVLMLTKWRWQVPLKGILGLGAVAVLVATQNPPLGLALFSGLVVPLGFWLGWVKWMQVNKSS